MLVVEHRLPVPTCRVDHPEPESSIGERNDLVAPARPTRVTARVRDDHDLELETLGAVDGEQANGSGAFFLCDRFELLRSQRLLVLDEAHERGEICSSNRLVLAGEPAELPQVGKPPCAVPTGEDREVVVVLGEDLLAEALEPCSRSHPAETLVALEECA